MTARNDRQSRITLRPEILAAIIIAHVRLSAGACACGYAELGASHAEHVVTEALAANKRAGYALRTMRAQPVETREQRAAKRALNPRARRVDP